MNTINNQNDYFSKPKDDSLSKNNIKTEEDNQINNNCANVYNINEQINNIENNYKYIDNNINESGLFFISDKIFKLKNQNLIKISLNSNISPEICTINIYMIYIILLSIIPFIIFKIYIFWFLLALFYFIIEQLIVKKISIYLYYNLNSKMIYIFRNKKIVNQIPFSIIKDFQIEKKEKVTNFLLNVTNEQPILLFKLYTKNYIERIEEEDILNNWLDYLKNSQ